jgi:hypothetical protein
VSKGKEMGRYRQRHILHDRISNIRTGNNGKRGSLNESSYFLLQYTWPDLLRGWLEEGLVDAGLWRSSNDATMM